VSNWFSSTVRVRKKASSQHSSDPLKTERSSAIERSFKSQPDRSTGPLRSCWVPTGWSQAEHFERISLVLFIAGHDGCVPNDDFGPDHSFPMKNVLRRDRRYPARAPYGELVADFGWCVARAATDKGTVRKKLAALQ
jgi:hypothetical protein